MKPDVLVIGHVVKDINDGVPRTGGGVIFASAQAARLGLHVAAVTRCERQMRPDKLLRDVEWHVAPSEKTTSFENTYSEGRRTQRILEVADAISLNDVPGEWRDAPMVMIAPVFHDVTPELPGQLAGRDQLIGLGAQGWLRRQKDARVLPGEVEARPVWLRGDAVFVSEEDVTEPEAVSGWQKRIATVVLTRGRGGCTVWHEGRRHELAASYAEEIDPTGAGDVFAMAFLVRLRETGDVVEAGRFAGQAAALAVTKPGWDGIGSRAEIETFSNRGRVRV